MRKLRVLSLFAGIGGFDLGLERTGGFETVAFCEIDPFCRKILAKHWPKVHCYHDVRQLTADILRADGIAVDVICGGFPCQDISNAGRKAGIKGERSGLWSEIARLVGELQPQYVILENVSALLGRGLGDVLGDLAALRYDAEWHCISASAVGAPHQRDRIWVVAYPDATRLEGTAGERGEAGEGRDDRLCVAEPSWCGALSDPDQTRCVWQGLQRAIANGNQWAAEPDVGRVAHGVPSRVDRLAALGNAVVPQIPELIGRAILESLDAG